MKELEKVKDLIECRLKHIQEHIEIKLRATKESADRFSNLNSDSEGKYTKRYSSGMYLQNVNKLHNKFGRYDELMDLLEDIEELERQLKFNADYKQISLEDARELYNVKTILAIQGGRKVFLSKEELKESTLLKALDNHKVSRNSDFYIKVSK